MPTQNSFKKMEKWTPFGAKVGAALFLVGALGGIIYLYLLFVSEGTKIEIEKTDLAGSIKGGKRQDLLKALEEREKKKNEAISVFDSNEAVGQGKKDPFNLP